MQPDSVQMSRSFYDAIGGTTLASRTRPSWDKSAVQTVQRSLRRHDRILDVGCGYGRITVPLIKKGFDVHGIDISTRLIAEARQAVPRHLRRRFRVSDMCSLPFKDSTFDVVLCLWSAFSELLHVKEQVAALKEMDRVLRKHGLCFVEIGDYKRPTKKELAEGNYCGHGGRIRRDVLFGLRNYHVNHDRTSLKRALLAAGIRNGMVSQEPFAGRSRQILRFTKD